jgi:hypothetical protein
MSCGDGFTVYGEVCMTAARIGMELSLNAT